MHHTITEQHLQFASSERDTKILEAYLSTGSSRKAAEKCGVEKSTVNRVIKRVLVEAAKRGYAPESCMTHAVPKTHVAKWVSTTYDANGEVKQQKVAAYLPAERTADLTRAIVEAMVEPVRGLAPIQPAPAGTMDKLLAVYPAGDPHFGLYCWGEEVGEDFDLEKARAVTLGAIDRLVQTAPAAKTALLLVLGDVFHADDQTNQTPAHHHQLDVDSRYVKVLKVCIDAYKHAILRMREKHERVVVRFVAGNHDPHAVWALALSMSAYFERDPRVEIDLSPAAHWYFRFGKVLIGSTHGDKSKTGQLPGVMAADRARDWGETLFRYWYLGHIHSKRVSEAPGVICESFRTLAAGDSYAAAYGYRAGRDMCCIVHHADFGEIERHRCDVAMLEPIGEAA
jgi:DNA-binding transcriptional regulator YdaS (Cro superfamily)